MPWFWTSTSNTDNAFDSLDANSRDFLRKTPSIPTSRSSNPTTNTTSSRTTADSFTSKQAFPYSSTVSAESPANNAASDLPSQTLFPDGRYAHLWSTYHPPPLSGNPLTSSSNPSTPVITEITPQEQLSSLLSVYRNKRSTSHKAALSNCVLEHIAEIECLTTSSIYNKIKGCSTETKQFTRCFTLQGKMLRAMGWLDSRIEDDGKGDERREGMLNRADELWTEVKRRAELRNSGRTVDEELGRIDFGHDRSSLEKGVEEGDVKGEEALKKREEELWKVFKASRWDNLRKEVEGLPLDQKVLELELQLAESKAHEEYGEQITQFYDIELQDRRKRKVEGHTSMGDWLKWLSGWTQ